MTIFRHHYKTQPKRASKSRFADIHSNRLWDYTYQARNHQNCRLYSPNTRPKVVLLCARKHRLHRAAGFGEIHLSGIAFFQKRHHFAHVFDA